MLFDCLWATKTIPSVVKFWFPSPQPLEWPGWGRSWGRGRGTRGPSCQAESGQCSCWLGHKRGRPPVAPSTAVWLRASQSPVSGVEAGGQLGGQYILAWAERTPGSTLWTHHRRSKNVLTGSNLMARVFKPQWSCPDWNREKPTILSENLPRSQQESFCFSCVEIGQWGHLACLETVWKGCQTGTGSMIQNRMFPGRWEPSRCVWLLTAVADTVHPQMSLTFLFLLFPQTNYMLRNHSGSPLVILSSDTGIFIVNTTTYQDRSPCLTPEAPPKASGPLLPRKQDSISSGWWVSFSQAEETFPTSLSQMQIRQLSSMCWRGDTPLTGSATFGNLTSLSLSFGICKWGLTVLPWLFCCNPFSERAYKYLTQNLVTTGPQRISVV